MTWLAWRQTRTETIVAAAVLLAVTVVLLPSGLHMADVFHRDGLGACLSGKGPCDSGVLSAFEDRFGSVTALIGWLNLVPAVIGALFAAPIVLDIEQGTFRLAWTQSITRRHWLVVRLAVMVLGAVVFGELLARLIGWWRGPLDQLHGRLADGFEFEGIVPAAYTLFAAALVLAIGALSRRTALAVLLGVILFLGIRIAVELELRPHYQTPIRATWTGVAGPDLHAAWVLDQSSGFRSASGAPISPSQLDACAAKSPGRKLDPDCLRAQGMVETGIATYHPNSRFWRFQLTETALYAMLSALLIGVAAWRIRRLA